MNPKLRFHRRRWPWALVVLAGCAGPPALERAILPGQQQKYDNALKLDTSSPKNGFLRWRAEQLGTSLEDAMRRDESLSRTANPFNASRDRAAVGLGAVVYANHCQRCHGENVDGKGPDVLPSHPCKDFHAFGKRLAVTLHGGAPRAWFRKISDGFGDVAAYPDGPSTAMPAFGEKLSREQIWLVITYLQSLDAHAGPEPT
jgi:mono/diheme cytochrome c family protein